jgi:hypothetical protein
MNTKASDLPMLTHWTGRAVCPYCQEAAHRDPERIKAHMQNCPKRYNPPHGAMRKDG